MGIVAFTLVGRAPQMLQNITGHQHAGVMGLAMGVAAGSLMARTGRSLAGTTPTGAGLTRMVRSRQEGALASAAMAGARGGVGARIARSPIGQAAGRVAQAGVARGGAALRAGINRLPTGAAQTLYGAGRLAAQTGRAVGARVHSAANSRPARAIRTAASLAYQPMATVGHGVVVGFGTEAGARDVLTGAQSAAASAVVGPERARQQLGLDAGTYTRVTGLEGSQAPLVFRPQAWQRGAYHAARRQPPAFLPQDARRYE